MGADKVRKALADAGLPRPYNVKLVDGESFVFRQTFPVDRCFTKTFLYPFLSDAKRVRPSRVLRPGYDKRRVEFQEASYVLFCPPEGGTSLVAVKFLPLANLQQATVKFRDLIGMMKVQQQARLTTSQVPQPRHRPRVALRA